MIPKLVPWHQAATPVPTLSYSAVLPDLRRSAATRRAEVEACRAHRLANGETEVVLPPGEGPPDGNLKGTVDGEEPLRPARPAVPRCQSAPQRRGVSYLTAHDTDKGAYQFSFSLQRPLPDMKTVHDGLCHGTGADEKVLREFVASKNLQEFEHLRLGDNRLLSAEALSGTAAHLPHLKEVCLRGTRTNNEVLANLVSSCPSLTSLDISDCDELTDLIPILQLSELQILKACSCNKAVTTNFVSALKVARKLEELNLSYCHGVTDKALQSLAGGCRALKKLSLAGCPAVTDVGLVAIASANPGIEELSVTVNSENLTDEGVATALRGLRRLKVFDCSGCTGLSQKTLTTIGRYCEWVEELFVGKLRDLKDEHLFQVVRGCPRLRLLDLTGCSSLSEQALVEAIPLARKLQRICLSMIPSLSEHALDYLRHRAKGVTFERHLSRWCDPNNLKLYLGSEVPAARTKKVKEGKKGKKKKKGGKK